MSIDSSKFCKEVIKKLKDEIMILKNQDKFNEYCINHLKAEICLLRDTLTKIGCASKECLCKHEWMDETLDMQLKSGTHVTHNGDEIKCVRESIPIYDTELKSKC